MALRSSLKKSRDLGRQSELTCISSVSRDSLSRPAMYCDNETHHKLTGDERARLESMSEGESRDLVANVATRTPSVAES